MIDDPVIEAQLDQALGCARNQLTALVIVPHRELLRQCLNHCVQRLKPDGAERAMISSDQLHLSGTTGSVRFFLSNHADWDATTQHLRGYPHHLPVFVIGGA